MLSFPVLVLDLVISYLKLKDRLSLSLTSKSLLLKLYKINSSLVVDLKGRLVKSGIFPEFQFEQVTINGRGLRDGITQIFQDDREDGKNRILKHIRFYSNGVLNGPSKTYQDGSIKKEYSYVDGKKHGKYTKFFSSGNVSAEKTFDMDKLIGPYNYYYPSGEIKLRSIPLDDGDRMTTTYYLEGHVESIHREKNGEYTILDEASPSLVRYSVNYVDGLKDSYELEFDKKGCIYRKVLYVKGLKQGKEEIFHSGLMYTVIDYVDGKRHGELVETIPRFSGFLGRIFKPRVILKCTYVKGKLEGVYRSFYDNGNPKEIRHYLHDELHGKIVLYNKDGSVRKKFWCKDGLQYRSFKGKLGSRIIEMTDSLYPPPEYKEPLINLSEYKTYIKLDECY